MAGFRGKRRGFGGGGSGWSIGSARARDRLGYYFVRSFGGRSSLLREFASSARGARWVCYAAN